MRPRPGGDRAPAVSRLPVRRPPGRVLAAGMSRRGGEGFETVVGWTVLGSVVPGVGLLAARRRLLGGLMLAVTVVLIVSGVGFLAFADPVQVIGRQLLARPDRLTVVAWALGGLVALWALSVLSTHVCLRRLADLTGAQRVLSTVLVVGLLGGGAVGAYVGDRDVLLTRDALQKIFTTVKPLSAAAIRPDVSGRGVDPWAATKRVNVLLIGSDAGADRTGLRTDSLMVASIDTRSGNTVLFGIPRNLEHAPFPPGSQQAADYPEGFVCPQHACLINALWQFGVEHKDTYYRGDTHPGLTATVQGVEQTLGLRVDNYAMLDLRGFMQFVDAVGGLIIDVTRRIPVGGHRDPTTGLTTGVTSYLQPGRQKLNGYQSLWFARSRSDSDDYERMRRQRCVIGAVTQQIDPRTVALNLPRVLQAAKNNISTDIPLQDLGAWVTLTLRVKAAHVRSLPFTNAVVRSSDPDFVRMHALVQEALRAQPTAASRRDASTSPVTSPSAGMTGAVVPASSLPTPRPTPSAPSPLAAQDVTAVC